MTDILSTEAQSVFKSVIQNGINKIVNNDGRMQRTPVISFEYYDSNAEEIYVAELSLVITSHTSKMNIMIDLSLEEDAIPEKYIGVKHSINKISKDVNTELNNILSDELSQYNIISLHTVNLETSGVKPNLKYDSISYRGEKYLCMSYYDELDIIFN